MSRKRWAYLRRGLYAGGGAYSWRNTVSLFTFTTQHILKVMRNNINIAFIFLLPACKAGHGMDRSRKCGRLLKILLVKSNVTNPYQIRQNIVSRPFVLKNTNLSSKEVLGNQAYV